MKNGILLSILLIHDAMFVFIIKYFDYEFIHNFVHYIENTKLIFK